MKKSDKSKGITIRTSIPVKFKTDEQMEFIKKIVKQLKKKNLLDNSKEYRI